MEHMLDKDVERVLFSEEELHRRVAEIAAEIDRDYAGREPLLVSVLRGSFVFMADLVRQIHLPCTVDFMAVSSYGAGTASSGQVRIIKDLSEHIEGRDVIVVEDILDSGNTLSYLLQLLQARSPASVRLCTLLDKPSRRTKEVELHYSGFTIPDYFVVGYGLDYAEKYRNLPYIGILKPVCTEERNNGRLRRPICPERTCPQFETKRKPARCGLLPAHRRGSADDHLRPPGRDGESGEGHLCQVRQLLEQQMVSRVSLEDNTVTLYLKEPQGGQSVLTYQIGNPDWFYQDFNDLIVEQKRQGIITDYDYPQGWVLPTG